MPSGVFWKPSGTIRLPISSLDIFVLFFCQFIPRSDFVYQKFEQTFDLIDTFRG
jgi:hypothetical protein